MITIVRIVLKVSAICGVMVTCGGGLGGKHYTEGWYHMWGDGTFGVGMGLRIVLKVSAICGVMVTCGGG